MNGFASVVGAVLSTILAMEFGFRVVLLLALGMYFVALVTLRGLLRLSANGEPVPAQQMIPPRARRGRRVRRKLAASHTSLEVLRTTRGTRMPSL